MTFAEIAEAFLIARALDLSPATVAGYRWAFDRFDRYLAGAGRPAFDQIDAATIRRFLAEADGALSRRSVGNLWAALSSLWTWAEAELGTAHAMRGRIARPRPQRNQPEPYSREEIGRMLEACEYTADWHRRPGIRTRRPSAVRDRALILILVDSGIRASELCALRVGDYDHKIGRLLIRHGKGDKSRAVYLGFTARAALWRYLQARKAARRQADGAGDLGDLEPLFVAGAGPFDRSNVLHLIQRIGRRAKVSGANVHRFRHTFAISFLRNGGNVYALQELLGHTTLAMVRQYLKIVDQDLRAAVAKSSPADNWRL